MRPIGRSDSALMQPLSSLLGTEANVRALRELALHGGELSAPLLAERTGVSPQQMRLVLANLASLGAMEALGSGRVRLYRLDKGYPLAPALVALFQGEEQRRQNILAALRKAVDSAGPAVRAAWLYGSVARGEDTAGSDLDLAVVAEENELAEVIETIRDELLTPSAGLRFQPSVVGLTLQDARRLARERDLWWVTISRDAAPIRGLSPAKIVRRRVEAA